ncbi:MAG: hypothetical protein Kow0031_23330 [Anaerolineae bacterium]
MTKRLITVITLIIAATAVLFLASQMPSQAASSATAGDALATASRLYQSGQYALAAQTYQQLADQGYGDSALYYNLGRAYQQQGEPGRAIVNYRRALALAPRDGDIAAALAGVRAQVAAPEQPGRNWLTLNEIAVLALAAWLLLALLVVGFTSSRGGSRLRRALGYATAVAAVVVAVSVIGLGSRMYAAYRQPPAVVVTAADVVAGPGNQFAALASLPAGSEVTLHETRGPWSRVTAPAAGVEGWVAAGAIEAVR